MPAAAKMSGPSSKAVSSGEPVLLTADQMEYDKDHDFLIAEGHVEVSQGETVLLADTLTYDQRNNTVFAEGHVSVMESSGNVYFADDMELNNDMKTGVVTEFKERLSDNSLLVASKAKRENELVTKLYRAVYSPCFVVCDDKKTPKTPLWQIQADKATIDKGEQRIVYRDAYMDFYGVPVLYTPYFSQTMPGADNKSGILTPTYQRNSNLGSIIRIPLYWSIAPDRDLTITPVIIALDSPILFGEYRQRFNEGAMKLDGSITAPQSKSANNVPEEGGSLRGHFFGNGDFSITDNSDWGFRIRRTTDDTYLRRYDINYDPVLTSRLYAEDFNYAGESGRNYASVQAFTFQGMQIDADPHTSPLVLPLLDAYYETVPMAWNSRFSLNADAMALTRDVGADSRRLSMQGKWSVPYLTADGHIFEFSTSLRGDAYDVSQQALPNGKSFDGNAGRLVPQTMLEWRYPLISRYAHSNLTLEPVVQAIASPGSGNSSRIPNEDSRIPEFTDVNLFSANRFAGYDRVESGPRMKYGMRSQRFLEKNTAIRGLLGQSYRIDNDPLFPVSNDLKSHFSDYVGMLGISYLPIDLSYRFRLDKDTLTPNRSELNASLSWERLGFSVNYLDLNNDPVLGNEENITGGTWVKLGKYWTLSAGANRDLIRNAFVGTNAGLIFQKFCRNIKFRIIII